MRRGIFLILCAVASNNCAILGIMPSPPPSAVRREYVKKSSDLGKAKGKNACGAPPLVAGGAG